MKDDYFSDWQQVPASQTGQVLRGQGGQGLAGDFLGKLVIIPASTSPGNVQIQDGSGAAITVFQGGAASVADLKSFTLIVGATSVQGPWKVTTGGNVSVIATGRFQ